MLRRVSPKECCGCDSDDGEGFAVQGEHAANDGRVGGVFLLPQAMAHDGDGKSAGLIISSGERAAGESCQAEHGEVVAGHKFARIALGQFGTALSPDA